MSFVLVRAQALDSFLRNRGVGFLAVEGDDRLKSNGPEIILLLCLAQRVSDSLHPNAR